jgi:hypothetical protein
MRQLIVTVALAALLFTVTATAVSAQEVASPQTGSTAYCADCHPDAHPDGWATTHARFRSSDPAEYAACADCHQGSFCLGCHKSGT